MSKEDEIAEYDVDKMKKKSRKNKIITSCVVGVLVVGLALGLGLGLGLKRTKPEEFYLQATSNGQELVVDDERYDTNQQITLEAKEIDGYDFAYWNFNGTQIEENPYTFTLTDSSFGTYTAVYVEKTLEAEHLYATSNGQQLVIDEETYQLGQQITIEASTIAGFEFSHWVFNESEITENPYTFNLTAENTGTYTAVYEEVELSLTYVVDGVSTKVSANEGQTIADLLPSEITDENSIGWFVDENFKTTANVLDEITGPVTIHTKMATLEELEIGQFALDSMLPVEQQDSRWYVRINDVSTSGDVVIPKAYGGKAVTAIYGQGFANSNISKIYIPDTITYMGDQAFYASAVSEVNFVGESQLAKISNRAFASTTNLNSITIPNSVTEISNYAFNASHIQNVLFEEGTQITTIGSQVFRDCPMIREFTLPAGVTTLGKNAFTDSGLVSFTFEDNFMLQVIDEATFRDSNLMSIKFGKNGALQTIGKTAFSGTRLEEIVIPASVTSIGVEAFKNSMLERLDFEKESLCTILDKDSFNNCQNLVFVALPESLKIATQPFKNCENLEVVEIRCNFSQDAINMEEGSDPVFYKDYNIREVNVVEGVTEFSIVDFIDSYGNSGGKIGGAEINIPSTILSLETSSTAFEYLISVNYLGNFEQFCKIQKFDYINASKFNASWTSESDVVIPEGITNVTETILSVFDGIDTLTLSSSVETIAPGLVKNTYVVSQDNQNFTSVDGVLYSKDESVLISYPKDKDSLNFSEKLKEIGDYAFKNCNLFTEIHLPEGIETISPNAFSIGCVIESIYLPNTAILTANLSGDIENFHINADHPLYSSFDNALYSKDFSELLFVPEGKTTISIHSNCSTLCTFSTNLQGLIFAEDSVITEIDIGFISGCRNLETITLPGQVESINLAAIRNFSNLETIFVSEENENYASYDEALYNKDFSELLFAPRKKETINIHSNCSTVCSFSLFLRELVFAEDSVITEINSGFIEGCTRLNVFILPGQLTSIGDSAFDGICSTYFSEITIPSTVTSIGAHAFSNHNFGNVYSTYIDTITINSAHIFQDTNSSASIGDALGEATTVYVEASLIDEQQLTAGSYLTSNFTRSATAVDGYYVYTRN